MHASLTIGDTTVMASMAGAWESRRFRVFRFRYRAREADAERLFSVLGNGGQVQMPLAKTFFSPRFGMVADRFGVSWMVHVEPREQEKR
jgi:PhnB protein